MVVLVPGKSAWAADVPVPPENLLSDRGAGKISAADKDFVIKVRLAGLWEIPAGEMAQNLSENNRVKRIGRSIADQHTELDLLARNAATKLKITLPNEPNEDQQGWLDEMESAQGEQFDQIYIDRLRAAHGKIFPAIANIRASTQNDTVRKLAQQANQFVMTHMTLLESSRLVDFADLAAAAAAAAPAAAATTKAPAQVLSASETGSGEMSGANMGFILAALAGGLAVGVFATKQLAGGRRPGYRNNRRTRYYGG
ncbi:Predicted outer membrane protein [Actinoplanes derwentensis]|uniref:Predicted outer membrane protein n=2 Tax=Actinoplanes derwentensis TaxID=113562 RepID=A0A1H2C7S6_9ACTN|nr:hypothetical protein Ade03nite_54900 [Actinoplanes derwentensis]SDT66302.1 Predicted outer membrane protein [Actinoplanes derwentensis]